MQTITINSPGPQGPQGLTGPSGSAGSSAPFTNISANVWATTSSLQLTGSLQGSSSYALTASYALSTDSVGTTFPYTGSATISGSLVVTGSIRVSGGVTSSLLGTASWAANATTAPLYLPLAGGTLTGNLSAAGKLFTFQDLTLGAGTTVGTIKTDGAKPIGIYPNFNFETTRFYANGSVGFQNGGTYSDTGYRVQISASGAVSGALQAIGNSSLSGSMQVIGPLDVSGSGNFSGSLTVTGSLTMGGSIFTSGYVGYPNNSRYLQFNDAEGLVRLQGFSGIRLATYDTTGYTDVIKIDGNVTTRTIQVSGSVRTSGSITIQGPDRTLYTQAVTNNTADSYIYFGDGTRIGSTGGSNIHYASGYYSQAAHQFYGGTATNMTSVVDIYGGQSGKPGLRVSGSTQITGSLGVTSVYTTISDTVSSFVGGVVYIGSNFANVQGNLGVGSFGNPGIRLSVKGSGTTSATTALRVENTNASASMVVLDNGYVGINTGSAQYNLDVNGTFRVTGGITMPNFSTITSQNNQINFETFRTIFYTSANTVDTQYGFNFDDGGGSNTSTSGTTGRFQLSSRFAPTTGTAVYNTFLLNTIINQTGGANGITRGLFINPTLTSAADFRAIETTTGSILFQSASLTVTGTTGSDFAPLGSELITGATATGTNWAGTALSTGYTHTPGSTVVLTGSLAATANTNYLISFTVSGNTAGRYESITFGGTTYMIYANNTTNSLTLRTTTTGPLYIAVQSATDGQIAITSVKAINDSLSSVTYKNSSNVTTVQQRADTSQLYYGLNAGAKFNALTINNTAFGQGILSRNSSGNYNTAMGTSTLQSATNTSYITAIGYNVFQNLNTAGNIYNVGIGGNIGAGLTTSAGFGNILIGWSVGNGITGANHNIAIGYSALNNSTTGTTNIAIGGYALANNKGGNFNTTVGYNAGSTSWTGVAVSESVGLVALGYDTRVQGENQGNQIVVGYQALGLGANSVVLGNDSITRTALKGNVSVGTTGSIASRLHVQGAGTTNATITLNVQNSAGTELFKVFDGGQIYVPQPAGTSLYLDTLAGYNTDRISVSRLVTGTGVSGMDASAQVEIQSTTKGFLPPRMTNAQRTSIVSPAVGLMVYCTDATEGLYIYKSTGWTFIA